MQCHISKIHVNVSSNECINYEVSTEVQGHRGRDGTVVRFTNTHAIRAYHH